MKPIIPALSFPANAFLCLGTRLVEVQPKTLSKIIYCDNITKNNTMFYGHTPTSVTYDDYPEIAAAFNGNRSIAYTDIEPNKNKFLNNPHNSPNAFISLSVSLLPKNEMMTILNAAEMFTSEMIIFQYFTTSLNKPNFELFDVNESDERLKGYKDFLKQKCGSVSLSHFYVDEPHPYSFLSFMEVKKIETEVAFQFISDGNSTTQHPQPFTFVLHTVVMKKVNLTAALLQKHFNGIHSQHQIMY